MESINCRREEVILILEIIINKIKILLKRYIEKKLIEVSINKIKNKNKNKYKKQSNQPPMCKKNKVVKTTSRS